MHTLWTLSKKTGRKDLRICSLNYPIIFIYNVQLISFSISAVKNKLSSDFKFANSNF